MRREHSFGIIPIREHAGGWEVLLVKHEKGHWAFPKGHADEGERPKQVAKRELTEETGLHVTSFLELSEVEETYLFRWDKEFIEKRVTYFVAKVDGKLTLQDGEITEARWLPLEEAPKLATFPEAKRLCLEVREKLSSLSM